MIRNSETFKVLSAARSTAGPIAGLSSGSGKIEAWRDGKWVPGGADIEEFMFAPPVSAAFAARVGIPASDLKS